MRVRKPEGPADPLTPDQVAAITILLSAGRTKLEIRDWALFRMLIDTMLRTSDIVRLTIGDVRDANGHIRSRFMIRQKKTDRQVHCMISEKTKEALSAHLDKLGYNKGPGAKLFPITTRQIQNRFKIWVKMIRLDPLHLSPHSARRTRPTEVYRKTGNLRAAQIMLGHSSIATTALYLGTEREQAMEIFGSVEM